MLALKIILIIALIFFLIGMIKVGISFNFIDDRLSLGIIVFGKRIELKRKKDKKPKTVKEEKPKKVKKSKSKPKKEKSEKKEKPVKYTLSFDDILEIVNKVFKSLNKLRKGFNVDRFLLHLVVATDDPYNTAVLFGKINSFLDSMAPQCSDRFNCRDLDVWTAVDFNKALPRLDIGFDITVRLHSFLRRIDILFAILGVIIKVKTRGIILRITDKKEYDYQIELTKDRKEKLNYIIKSIKNKKAEDASNDKGNNERMIS